MDIYHAGWSVHSVRPNIPQVIIGSIRRAQKPISRENVKAGFKLANNFYGIMIATPSMTGSTLHAYAVEFERGRWSPGFTFP